MENVLQRLPTGARVAVLRLRSLGDCVLTTPALEILKRSRPDLKVAVVVEDRFASVFQGNPDVEALLSPKADAIRKWSAELCLNLHGGVRSMVLTMRSLAAVRAGFRHFRGSFLLNLRIPAAQEILGVKRKVHTAEHLASAMFYLGAPRTEIPRAKLFAEPYRSGQPYAVIHPLATGIGKTWPARGFLEVARHLAAAFNLEPFFIAGPGEDLSAFRRYQTMAGAPLGEIKALLAGASLFVGNDSGPAHMAAAFGLPVLVIFGSSDPVIWGPWKTASQVILAADSIESVKTAEVLAALERLRVVA
jgi:ADP-heptose:LPS heptosyltransferase